MIWDRPSKRIIVNADDFGLTAGVCRAIIDASRDGIVSNTSAMVCSDTYLRNAAAHFASLAIPCGVHLQLTDGRPVSSEMAAFLVRETGSPGFPDEPGVVAMPAELVRAEWDAQVQCFTRNFGTPSHLDSHHWVHLVPEYVEAYCETAARHDLPVRGALRGRDRHVYEALAGRGVRSTFDVVNIKVHLGDQTPGDGFLSEPAFQPGAAGEVVHELLTHPGYSDPELARVSPLNARREVELTYLRDRNARRALTDGLGFSIVDYRSLSS